MILEDIFGLPVGVATLTTLDCQKGIDYLDRLSMIGKEGPEGEYTQDQQILEEDIFKEVKQEVIELTLQYSQQVLGHKVQGITIATSWANYTHSNEYIRPHTHPNSYISGCFYLNQGSNIAFHNPVPRKDMYMVSPSVNFNPNNKYTWATHSLTPRPNMLAIFPSGLTHSVDNSPTKRYSVAYNTMPTGLIGKETGFINIKELDNSKINT